MRRRSAYKCLAIQETNRLDVEASITQGFHLLEHLLHIRKSKVTLVRQAKLRENAQLTLSDLVA